MCGDVLEQSNKKSAFKGCFKSLRITQIMTSEITMLLEQKYYHVERLLCMPMGGNKNKKESLTFSNRGQRKINANNSN